MVAAAGPGAVLAALFALAMRARADGPGVELALGILAVAYPLALLTTAYLGPARGKKIITAVAAALFLPVLFFGVGFAVDLPDRARWFAIVALLTLATGATGVVSSVMLLRDHPRPSSPGPSREQAPPPPPGTDRPR